MKQFSPLSLSLVVLSALAVGGAVLAQQPPNAQTPPAAYEPRLMPPPGIPIPDATRTELTAGVAELAKEIEGLKTSLKSRPELLAYLPDVEIYHKAVSWALDLNEFFSEREFDAARAELKEGMARAKALGEGKTPWMEQTGPVVFAYRSRIDDSLQPYGLVIPADYKPGGPPRRLDYFFHGRGEKLSELAFINDRSRSPGEFTPEGAFVVHPYGRFCNANRFAGEADTFEVLANIKKRFPIDENRLVVRGFSMGGASAWGYTVHHADMWVAAAPGAGFSETAEFTQAFRPGKTPPPWYEQTLWHLYDATDYAINLTHCPTVAYSGEIDGQKQAADRMVDATKAEGMTLKHVIGPKTGHQYHPDSKKEINAFIDAAIAKGKETMPNHVQFTTWTLAYPNLYWVRLEGLEEHWKRARVDATVENGVLTAKTENVSSISFVRPDIRQVVLDGVTVGFSGRYIKDPKTKQWRIARIGENYPGKRPGLQGPIDDAFMGKPILFVRPTGTPLTPELGAWTKKRMEQAIFAWKKFYRGEVKVVDDTSLQGRGGVRNSHLILWGDTQSNSVLREMAGKLPFRWDAKGMQLGNKTYANNQYAPVFIYPNPTPSERGNYIVVNSGYTFIDFSAGSNADHCPKLPDWAILDTTIPGPIRTPGQVTAAGFFDENWKLSEQK